MNNKQQKQNKRKRLTLLDLVCRRFPQESRETLFSWILCGDLRVDGQISRDPKSLWFSDAPLEKKPPTFVSRGAEKLLPVLEKLIPEYSQLDPKGHWVLDAGSSTGGFIQVLLMLGAKGVYGVDVGTNQLDYSLRSDPRVRVMEQTNIVTVQAKDLHPLPRYATADLSFRALGPVVEHILDLTSTQSGIFLLKPQFEFSFAGLIPPQDFTGVCSDDLGLLILEKVCEKLMKQSLRIIHHEASPIRGTQGNQEFFLFISRLNQDPSLADTSGRKEDSSDNFI